LVNKRYHEAGLINDKGDHVGKTIRFANSRDESIILTNTN